MTGIFRRCHYSSRDMDVGWVNPVTSLDRPTDRCSSRSTVRSADHGDVIAPGSRTTAYQGVVITLGSRTTRLSQRSFCSSASTVCTERPSVSTDRLTLVDSVLNDRAYTRSRRL